MDLTGQDTIKTLWSVDSNTGVLTVTFKTEDESTELGTFTLEGGRFHSMIDALGAVGDFYLPRGPTRMGHRSILDNTLNKATTVFE